jgi:hypothetical protein
LIRELVVKRLASTISCGSPAASRHRNDSPWRI